MKATQVSMANAEAENKLNMGKPAEAEVLHREARSYREEGPDEDALSVRVKLRTGRTVRVTRPNMRRQSAAFDRITWDEQVWLSWDPSSPVVVTQ